MNKKPIKVIALMLYAIITIATCAGVWNFCPEVAVKWAAFILFVCNGISIYRHAKRLKD